MKKYLILLLNVIAFGLLSSCGGDDDLSASPTQTGVATQTATTATPTGLAPTSTPVPVPITDEITVFAASSLTAAFTQIGADFEAAYPGVRVNFSFGGSQNLKTQLEQGAQADVYAAADTAQMDAAARSGVVAGLRPIFAYNKLVIITPKANEANIKTPQDLARAGVKIVIAGEDVPVGRYTRQFLDAASATASFGSGYKDAVLANVVSEASNVKEVAAAVQLDEVDAGVVYVTDVTDAIADDVTMIDIPEAVNQTATYPISLTYSGFSNEAAQTFIGYVLSETGQDTLASFGFMKAEQ